MPEVKKNNNRDKHRHLQCVLPSPSNTFFPFPPQRSVRGCQLWALQSSSLTPTGRAVRPQLLTVRQTPPEKCRARKTALVAPLIRQAAAAAPHSSTLFLCLLTTLCPTAQKHWIPYKSGGQESRGEEREEKKVWKEGGLADGWGLKKHFFPRCSTNKLWQRQRGFFLAPTQLLGIVCLTRYPPFSLKRYDSYCLNQPRWMEWTEAKSAPGVNTPVWKKLYCRSSAWLTCPGFTSFLM